MSSQFIPISGHRFHPQGDCTLHCIIDSSKRGPVVHEILVGEPGELAPSLLAVSDELVDFSLNTLVDKVYEIIAYLAAIMGFGMIVHLQIKESIGDFERPRDVRRTVTYWCSDSVLDRDESLLGRKNFNFLETVHSVRATSFSNRQSFSFSWKQAL